MRLQQVSLQIKLISAISAIIIFLLLFSTYLNLQFLRRGLEDSLGDTSILLAKQIDTTIENKKRLEDPALLKREVFEIIQLRRHIQNIDIYLFPEPFEKVKSSERKEGYRMLIASNTATIVPLSTSELNTLKKNEMIKRIVPFQDIDRILEVISPLHLHKKVIGAITIQSSFDEMEKLLELQQRQAYLITFITLLVIVPLLALYLQTAVNRPIKTLIHAMSQAEANRLPIEVKITRNDELGYLAENFNRMVNRLAEAEKERSRLLDRIHQFNIELQQKVLDTTKELVVQHNELKRAHEQLVSMQRRLIEADKLATMGQVAATIAHEVGTPLGAVSGHIQLLREQYKSDESAQNRLEIIEKQINRVVNIIQNLLNSVRERTAEVAPVSINQLLNEIITLMAPQFTQQKVKLTTHLAERLPLISGNADQLQQVFLNLFTNALDAMPAGGELTVQTVNSSSFADPVIVEIIDSGKGIPQEHLSQIFDPFFTTKSPGEGTGIGLSVCKDIVERHGGTIAVESKLNQGTKFIIQFPIQEGAS